MDYSEHQIAKAKASYMYNLVHHLVYLIIMTGHCISYVAKNSLSNIVGKHIMNLCVTSLIGKKDQFQRNYGHLYNIIIKNQKKDYCGLAP